jgi:hypothetical protein
MEGCDQVRPFIKARKPANERRKRDRKRGRPFSDGMSDAKMIAVIMPRLTATAKNATHKRGAIIIYAIFAS